MSNQVWTINNQAHFFLLQKYVRVKWTLSTACVMMNFLLPRPLVRVTPAFSTPYPCSLLMIAKIFILFIKDNNVRCLKILDKYILLPVE